MEDTRENQTLSLLTLNCWGIPYVSKNVKSRMEAIANKLQTEAYDIVCLQEIWSVNDFKMIKARVREQLPHSHYFYSGVVGSGICIFSRFLIQDVMFHKWPLNGYVHKIHHGDWFGGKGVGLCRIKLHAEYNKKHDEYKAHRVLQAFDTAQFIRMTMGGADAVILGGDLNSEPQDLAYRIILGIAGLQDACSIGNSTLGTNECAKNSYTNAKLCRKEPEGKRIDHIFYLGSKNLKLEVTNFKQPFPHRIPEKNFSYSDHEAVMATFNLIRGEHGTVDINVQELLKEALGVCEVALRSIPCQRIGYLISAFILIIPLIFFCVLDYSTNSIAINIGINIAYLFLTVPLCYLIFMGTIWNMVEKNALTAGYLAMELHLLRINNNICSNM